MKPPEQTANHNNLFVLDQTRTTDLRDMERSIILTRLLGEGLSERVGLSRSELEEIVLWGDRMLDGFTDYKYATKLGAPHGIAGYFRGNSMTAEEHGLLYSQRIAEGERDLRLRKQRENLPYLDVDCANLRTSLEQQGKCEKAIAWEVRLFRAKKLAKNESDIGADLHRMRQAISSDSGTYERLPSLENRLKQLANMWALHNALGEQDCSTRLIPVPYASFRQSVFPSYSPTDQRPKITNDLTSTKAKDLDIVAWYFDPQLQVCLSGINPIRNVPYQRTQYAQAARQADAIGNFGLALVPQPFSEVNNKVMDIFAQNDAGSFALADIYAGLAWALAHIKAVRRNEASVPDEDIKVVLPKVVRDINGKLYHALLTLYRTNKGSVSSPKFGIAYNLVDTVYVADGSCPHNNLSCIGWNAFG